VLRPCKCFCALDSANFGRFPNDNFFARVANAGLAGDFGKVTAGRNTSPYYLPNVFFNSFGGSFGFSPTMLHTF
jgi:predicted porin